MSARFRDVIAGSHRAISRAVLVEGHQFGPNPTGVELPILGGDVQLTASSDIKGTLDLTVPADYFDQVDPYGLEIFVERGIFFGDGSTEMVPVGYFRIDDVVQRPAPNGPARIDGVSREAQLIDNRPILPYQVPTGVTHRSAFYALVNGYTPEGGAQVVAPMFSDAVVPIDWDDAGYDPDEATVTAGQIVEDSGFDFLAKLASARGCVLRFRPTGELAVERVDGAELAAGRIGRAAQELIAAFGDPTIQVHEDFSFVGMSDNGGSWNDGLVTGYIAAHPGATFEPDGDGHYVWTPDPVLYLERVVEGEAALSPVVWEIHGGPSGTLVDASRSKTRRGVYNLTRAVGSDTTAQTGYQIARITDPLSPLRQGGLFGTVPRFYASPVLKTAEAAAKAAETIQARVRGLPKELSLFVVPNPALRPLDIISSALTGRGQQPERHVLESVTIPLASGEGASAPELRTRTMNAIADVSVDDPQDPNFPDPTDPTDPVDPTDPTDPGPGTGEPDPTDGTQAAVQRGWGAIIDGDEFDYTGRPSGKWGLYDGAGHDGNGRRSPSAYTVHDGMMTCHGENKVSGGCAFSRGEMGARVEIRARVYNTGGGNDRYHPVLILWPDNDDWPGGAEYDFMECDEGTGKFGLFMHLPNHQPYRQDHYEEPLDLTQWHNYACEWNPSAKTLKAYVDGREVYAGSGRVAEAPGPMHLTIQLDDFGGNPRPCNFDIAWVRHYQRPNA
ncbi:DUF5047 domain-containing protein [Pseudonocardia pini]|uniref:DUF5047 domain-containing protein n=1 Tax=Pseudonocardia pini TaxID=2758030 RepID=UPI0015F0494C|nr:DUF5047 domain-containing protein [Pseudonocardia pini]